MQSTDPMLFSLPNCQDSLVDVPADADCVRVISAPGMSLLYANAKTEDEAVFALELLRGFRAVGRRVVLCDTSQLTTDSQPAGTEFGRTLVHDGSAEILITCGPGGREVAVGARDAGLDLASVVVCRAALETCAVLAGRLTPGDTVLLLGIQQAVCDRLVALLNKRALPTVAVAA